jgi:ABC-type antimicrobial peptide transport system permease subunit
MRFSTVGEIMSGSVSARRFYTVSTMSFAMVALALTMVGIGIIVSRSVVERRRELAIRSALGATSRSLVRVVVAQGLMPMLIGGAVGAVLALASGRVIRALLFDVPATDPRTYGVVIAVLLISATAAALVPARKVLATAPAETLRSD